MRLRLENVIIHRAVIVKAKIEATALHLYIEDYNDNFFKFIYTFEVPSHRLNALLDYVLYNILNSENLDVNETIQGFISLDENKSLKLKNITYEQNNETTY